MSESHRVEEILQEFWNSEKSLKQSTLQKLFSRQLKKVDLSINPEYLEGTLSTLRKIFDNIIQHQNDDKYHKIKLADKTFSSEVWRYPACEELMKMSGWVVEGDHMRLRDDSQLHIVSQLLESLCGQKDVNKK